MNVRLQKKYLTNLTLQQVGVNRGEGGMGYQDSQAEGFERFVVRE